MSTVLHTRRFVLALIGCAFMMLTACGKSNPDSSATKPERAPRAASGANERVYLVGTNASYAPFESKNAAGEIEGFDIDIVKAIAKQVNIKVRFVDTPWTGIFDTLSKGERDMVVSAITITEERRAKMDFSKPYFFAHQAIAIHSNTPVRSIQDLKNRTVAVQKDTIGDQAVSKFLGESSAQIKRYESLLAALNALKSGSVDAVVGDNGPVLSYIRKSDNADLKMVKDFSTPDEHYGIAIAKGNQDLLATINKGLVAIKTNGIYEVIYQNHFGGIPSLSDLDDGSIAKPK